MVPVVGRRACTTRVPVRDTAGFGVAVRGTAGFGSAGASPATFQD